MLRVDSDYEFPVLEGTPEAMIRFATAVIEAARLESEAVASSGGRPVIGVRVLSVSDDDLIEDRPMPDNNKRHAEIYRRWNAGESPEQIAKALGTKRSTVAVTMHRMRSRGWHLPARLPSEYGKKKNV